VYYRLTWIIGNRTCTALPEKVRGLLDRGYDEFNPSSVLWHPGGILCIKIKWYNKI